MKVLERAAGHASGPYHVPAIDVRSCRRADQQPDLRGVPWLRRQPGPVRHGGRDRPAGRAMVGIDGWEIRKRNVIHPGEVWGPGQIMDDGSCRRRGVPRRDQAACTTRHAADGKAVGLGLGLKNSGLGNGFRELCRRRDRASVTDGRGRGPPRLDRDGPRSAHRRTASCRAGAGDRSGAHRGHRRYHSRARLRPDHRVAGHADGRRVGPQGVCGCARRRLPVRRRLRRRARGRLDPPPWRSGPPQPDDPRCVRICHAAGRGRPRSPATSNVSSPSTMSARRSTRCCAKARSKAACTWASATP